MPKYRILVDYTPVISNLYMAGDVVDYPGWPRWTHGAVEGADDDARAILAYWSKQNTNPWLPATPIGADGTIYLPGTFQDPRSSELPGHRLEESANLPRYTVKAEVVIGAQNRQPGEEVSFLGWPVRCLDGANEFGERIMAYFEEHRQHAHLPPSPWNLYTGLPYLPALSAKPLQRVEPSPPSDWPRRARQARADYNPLASR